MTSTNLSQKQLNFAQISIVCVDILKQCLIDILHIHIKPTDLGKEIRLSPSLTAGKDKLSSEQKDLCCPLSPGVPDYGKFDVTLLYKLIRNLCPKLKPSKEWGKEPDTADQKIGDDIERIRLFRNKHYAHPNSAEITESDFTDLWNEGESLIYRIQIFTTAKGCKTDYGLKLTNISGRMIKYEEYTSYVNLFRAIYIERNVEVTCGDTAHFKADIRLEESAFLSVSWERVDGSATNHIDISCEKYKGSTSRQLNIHSVCKEDEGEYQAVISRNIDHKIFSNIGFLRTQGELPRLDNLKVSTTKEEICIHYSHTVLENSPRVTDIEWTKNETPLDLTDHKYCGGGLENSCLTISCPTKEDGGEYSCTVTNAVGSVSRVVILKEPSAKISTNTPVVHGSETRFSCLISSCPSSEEIEWQKSCDGNTFYPIDINELKYHGSNEDPSSPVLCLPKTTFDDQQFYRIAVRNKIGECMSSTHFLEVVGNRPNITNAICTTKDRSVRLNCDVFLYDKSPPLQEVYWTKNEHRLDVHGSGGKYSGRVSPDDRSLTINNVNKHDAGNYQLTAINSVGPTYSDVIVLGVPDVVLKKKYKNEDGSQCFMITIKSNPAPFFVQWSMKDKKSGTLQQINVNADEYKGTSNSFPRPMLVVKHKETLENYRFRIEVENVIGFTEKVIPDETSPIPLKSDDNTVNVGNLNRVYEKRGRNIRFGKVFDELAEKFPEAKIGRLKDLIQNSCEVEDVRSLKQAKSARDCFRILRSENIFTPEDVICLQYLLKMTECEELERKCIEYAKMQKALYYYEKPPDNGYMNVHFHIVANIRGYGTENITKVRETVAAIVGCTIEEVLVNGYLPSASFILVLSIKNNLVNKLLALKRKDEDKLSKLSIDYFKIGGTTIRLEFLRDQDEPTTVYPYPESSGLSEMPYFSDYDFMESGSDQDEHTTVYPYPESSGLSEMPYFSDYDFMESVYEKCDVELLERRENEIMFTETKEFQAMYENVRNQVQAVVNDPGKAAMGIKARLKHQKDGMQSTLSDAVYDGLSLIIGTETEVNIRREVADTAMIERKKSMKKDYDFILAGSYREGFRRILYDSNFMFWRTDYKVICDPDQITLYSAKHLTVVQMECDDIPLGFTRLKIMTLNDDRLIHSCIAENSMLYVSSSAFRKNCFANHRHTSCFPQIPFFSLSLGGMKSDVYLSFQSDHWPQIARPWIQRCQQKGWPMNTIVTTIMKSGVHIVPIGSSPNEDLEWRISFSMAEQKLVYSFNHCQFLCYGLLKIFLMEVINAQSKTPVLYSYFLKTVMFWVIQNDITLIWTPDNLLYSFWNCLKLLIHWVNTGYCPNFFVPQNNMFRLRVTGHTQYVLFEQLNGLYCKGIQCLQLSPTLRHFITCYLTDQTYWGAKTFSNLKQCFFQEMYTNYRGINPNYRSKKKLYRRRSLAQYQTANELHGIKNSRASAEKQYDYKKPNYLY